MSDHARSAAALFDPDRLKLAREAAGLTKVALAERVDVTGPAVSQFENGQNRPTPATVGRLAWALNVVPAFFERRGRPVPLPTSEEAFFRSVRSTTRLQRRQASARAAILAEIAREIEQLVEVPPVRLPPAAGFDEHTADSDVVAVAAATRQALDIGDGPVRHLIRQLEARGVLVTVLSEENGRVSAFSQWFDQRPLIVLQAGQDDVARRRFDAAHELGHLVLHDEPDPGNAVLEQQANIFAAAFLMPAAEITEELPQRYDLQQLVRLKHTWGTSIQALLYRSRELGRLSPDAYQRAIVRFSATYGRRHEPYPLRDGETPVLLWRAAELAFGEDPLPALAAAVALPEERVRELLDAPAIRPRLEPSVVLADLSDRQRSHRARRREPSH